VGGAYSMTYWFLDVYNIFCSLLLCMGELCYIWKLYICKSYNCLPMFCDSLNEGRMNGGHRSRPQLYFLSIANTIFLTKLKLELELQLEL